MIFFLLKLSTIVSFHFIKISIRYLFEKLKLNQWKKKQNNPIIIESILMTIYFRKVFCKIQITISVIVITHYQKKKKGFFSE